jgi:putative endonuclease
MGGWAYIIECADGSYYVGSTVDLEARISQHNLGLGAKYTRLKRRRPVKLVWDAQFDRIDDAFEFEKRVQGWSRAKRRALIEGRMDDLPALARGHCRPPMSAESEE